MEKKIEITLTKIKELEDATHPFNIEEGYSRRGELISEPEIGQRFYVGWNWSTSPVREIIDENTFKTLNSIYKINRT
jgi:hypothetical protein